MASSCHNCGCPPGANSNPGQNIVVTATSKEYGEKRPRKSAVWCCSEECCVQALGISKYGTKTSSWPVTLNQWRPIARRQLKEPQ
jgi:hypothetical protein